MTIHVQCAHCKAMWAEGFAPEHCPCGCTERVRIAPEPVEIKVDGPWTTMCWRSMTEMNEWIDVHRGGVPREAQKRKW